MSSSLITRRSSPSTFTSVPEYFPKRILSPTFTSSGLTSPFSNNFPFPMAIGKGKLLENGDVRPLDVKVGDKILFGKYSGTEVNVDGEDLLVMREDDITAIIN